VGEGQTFSLSREPEIAEPGTGSALVKLSPHLVVAAGTWPEGFEGTSNVTVDIP
jgi:hypothetical protein